MFEYRNTYHFKSDQEKNISSFFKKKNQNQNLIFTSMALGIFMKWVGEKLRNCRREFKQLFSSKLLSGWREKKIQKTKFKTKYNSPTRRKIHNRKKNVKEKIIIFIGNPFEMRLLNLRINFYLLRTFRPHLGSFFFVLVVSSHYVSAKFHLWPSSGNHCDLQT